MSLDWKMRNSEKQAPWLLIRSLLNLTNPKVWQNRVTVPDNQSVLNIALATTLTSHIMQKWFYVIFLYAMFYGTFSFLPHNGSESQF